MKSELIDQFSVRASSITVISYPTNSIIPNTSLTPAQAKAKLDLRHGAKVVLFFGRICPYKGIEYLLAAFRRVIADDPNYRLIIAGEPSVGAQGYLERSYRIIKGYERRVLLVDRFIQDDEVEVYFKAADVLVLPYKDIFQSGVLYLAYSFGLPVIATDVGSLREAVIEGKTGFVCRPGDPVDLARRIDQYFQSILFRNLDRSRQEIREYVEQHHSAEAAAGVTRNVYTRLLGGEL
jgi:glycosyltransferase involved in cell wall biosynthesis